MADLVDLGGSPANPMERETIQRLVRELPKGGWSIIPNASLPDPSTGHAYEYDAIVVAPHAVYAIEMKGWGGRIRQLGQADWERAGGRIDKNPLPLIDLKARVLKGTMRNARLGGRRAPYTQGCLVVGREDAEFDVPAHDARRCLRPSELIPYLRDPSRLQTSSPVEDSTSVHNVLVQAITGHLEGRKAPGRRFGSYLATSLEARTDDGATWLGRHALLAEERIVRIRSWYLSPYRYDPPAREERLDRLRRAAEALAKVGEHPNIATLRDFGESDGEFYEITDWTPTGTLLTAFLRGRLARLDVAGRISLLAGLGRGLDAAQRHGVIHRALSPDRILLDGDLTPRLTGFDLAWLEGATHTVYGGSSQVDLDLAFVAPELRETDYEVFDNTDLFALGRIALLVFGADAGAEEPAWTQIRALAERCAAADPADRPANPAAFLAELAALTVAAPEPVARTTDEALRPGDTIDGVNTILEELGRGTGTVVYRVANEPLSRELALKLALDGREAPDLSAEYRLLRSLTSPRFPRAHWFGRHGSGATARPYLLMDLVSGPSLRQLIASKAVTPERALALGLELIEAVGALHEAGVLHRDIKPEHVVVTATGIMLVDLGSARPIHDAGRVPDATLRYTPPDLAATGWTVKADLFAVACVIAELHTGALPWEGAPPSAGRITLSDERIPDRIRGVLDMALAGGFADVGLLRTALEVAAIPPPPPPLVESPGEDTDEPIWSASRIIALATHPEVLVPLARSMADAILDGTTAERRLLETERRLQRLESPLGKALPSALEALRAGRGPLTWHTGDPFGLGYRPVWAIENVHPMDWSSMCGSLAHPSAFWAAGEGVTAAVTFAKPARTLVLPVGERQSRSTPLDAVLAERATSLSAFLADVRAAGPVTLVAISGALYLTPDVPVGWFRTGGLSLAERLLPIVHREGAS